MSTRKPTNEEIAKRIVRGSTTRWDNLQVLFNNGTWALVKWPGCSPEHVSPWVTLYNVDKLDFNQGDNVWSSDLDGRLTKNRLHNLIVKLKLDPAFIIEVPAKPRGKHDPGH